MYVKGVNHLHNICDYSDYYFIKFSIEKTIVVT